VPGDTASLSSGDTQPPDLANPLAWGWVGAALYPGGSREAPNGRAFNPLSSLDLDFNLQLLPHNELYLFTNDSLWIQRSGWGPPVWTGERRMPISAWRGVFFSRSS
jgi:hypothetical protein